MAVGYRMISWDRQKRLYDATLAAFVLLGLGTFIGATLVAQPASTAETVIIRGTALAAFLLLHVILCIGPLARLDARFLPLLYNRRHLGVTMFFLALVHAVFSTIQFHALGDANPIVSIFTAYSRDYLLAGGASQFPFEAFGAIALVILFLMAATSHDFWLKNLGASFWKALHLLVYFAYGLLVVHVALGTLQSERSLVYPLLLAIGFIGVMGLHLAAWRREARLDAQRARAEADGFFDACSVHDAPPEGKGRTVVVRGERIALYRHEGRLFAVSNVCRHQGGPIGEGRIVDGCITCPWHGWNYQPHDGCSPPPFREILPTYPLRIEHGRVWVNPSANAPETVSAGAPIEEVRA